jgi:protease I
MQPTDDHPSKEAAMGHDLSGKNIAVLAADGVEQVELTEPMRAARDAGAVVHLISLRAGSIQGVRSMDKADTFSVDRVVSDVSADEYDGLIIPGGVKNPDTMRMDETAVALVRSFFEQGKPVAAICHAPWILVEADVVRGRTLTSYPSLRTDIRNAGGTWVDEEVRVDQGLVTSRRPDDLEAFNEKLLEEFAEGVHAGQRSSTEESVGAKTGRR